MFKRIFLPVAAVLLLVAMGVYYWLGGFNAVQVTQTTSKGKTLAGAYYDGPVRSAEFSALFKQVGELVQSGQLKGRLGGIYYNNPEEAEGTIKAFIGVVVDDTTATLPPNFELRSWPANQRVLQAEVNAHYSLVPGKAYPALFDYAEENNLTLKNLYFEQIEGERNGQVQVVLQ